MGSRGTGRCSTDLWAQVIAEEDEEEEEQQRPERIEAIYRRRRPKNPIKDVEAKQSSSNKGNRVSFAPGNKRISWNRSLSARGRTSIAIVSCVDHQPKQRQAKRKGKPGLPKGKVAQLPSFEKERTYFEEVDAFELLEESASPKNLGTWAKGNQSDTVGIPQLTSRLEKWLISKKLNYSFGPSSTLSKIFETPAMPLDPTCDGDSNTSNSRTPKKSYPSAIIGLHSDLGKANSSFIDKDELERDTSSQKCNADSISVDEDIEIAVQKLSLTSKSDSLDDRQLAPFSALLAACEQSTPSKLMDVFSKYCDSESIVKLGEGTFGEAFRAGNNVCKIVPIDGDSLVNGEIQKRSEELLEEVILSRTLNQLRGHEGDVHNSCTTFIKTIDLKVCQGPYDVALIKAWENWDEKHGSENDHPKEFQDQQCYVIFVLEHGGKDLESFVLLNFEEACSLLVQVTAALAVAEAEYEFEHRDLHWGNVLLSRKSSTMLKFTLDGKHMYVKTYGLLISIIDFTLSRINTGEDILFLDLSSDPYLFKGPKGDRQSETYRKMKEVTEDYWEGSFPRTNVLWLLYLVDTLLMKKSFERSSKNERDLRSLKKCLDKYQSVKEAIFDPFFSDLISDSGMQSIN